MKGKQARGSWALAGWAVAPCLAPSVSVGDADLEALRARCEAEREARIAPLRQKAIEAGCECSNRAFGAVLGRVPGLKGFHDVDD
jgi:hypothetical protein